jgi:hypothetical protein
MLRYGLTCMMTVAATMTQVLLLSNKSLVYSPNFCSLLQSSQQLPKSPSAQIALDGILQKAALDSACMGTYDTALNAYKTALATYEALVAAGTITITNLPPVPPKAICGGTLTVNNEVVTVPKNAMVMFPANALTWQEMFNGGTETGLAVADNPRKPGGYSVSIAANRVNNQIIAATIDIAQAVIISAGGEITHTSTVCFIAAASALCTILLISQLAAPHKC